MAIRFGRHVSNYAWAELAVTVAGLLSFPILTRLLSVADYGMMNLVASALALTVALGKLGVQHAALRGWAEVEAGRSPHSRQAFESTVILGMVASGAVITLLWAAVAGLIPTDWWAEPEVGLVMVISAPLIVVRALDSALMSQLRAQERSAEMALFVVIRRYAILLAVVLVLVGVSRDVKGFYLATLAVELVAILILLGWMFRAAPLPTPGRFSRPLFGSLLLFGVPMLGSELASVVLMMSDRFFVQSVLGAESLGIYAASWNMCDHLRNALLGAMVGAAYPRCMKLWEQGGVSGLQTFVDRFLHVYIMVAAGLVAWTGVLGGELMAVLASPKYAEGGAITGWLMAGLAVQSVMTISAVGLYLARRTLAAMVLVLAAGVLSMLANSLLIPLWGLKGAAIALLAVFLVLNAAQMVVARRTVPLAVPWRSLLRWSLAAALAAWLVTRFSLPDLWLDLLVRSAVLILVYGALVLALDRDLRRWLLAWQLRRKTV